MSSEPPKSPPQLSPDGRYWWDGEVWIPVDGAQDAPPPADLPRPAAPAGAPRFRLPALPRAPLVAALLVLLLVGAVVGGTLVYGRLSGSPPVSRQPPTAAVTPPAPSPSPSSSPSSSLHSVSGLFDNVGISDSRDVAAANFDGTGDSYSAGALAGVGYKRGAMVTAGGVTFEWPSAGAGKPDNILARGQPVQVTGTGTAIDFLGASSHGTSSGSGTVTYTDGSTSSYTLTLDNWTDVNAGPGDAIAACVPYVHDANPATNRGHPERKNLRVCIFDARAPIQPGKRVQSLTLPHATSLGQGGQITGMHVFAISVH